MPDLGLTRQAVLNHVTTMMGHPRVTLHVTAQQVNDVMSHFLDVISRRKPRVKYATLAATGGKQNYTPDPDKVGYGVLSVLVPRIDPIAPLLLSSGPRLDIFGYRYSYPYRDIAELEWDYTYFDMATRTLSSEIDWEFIDGDIYIYPAPTDSFQFAYAYAAPKVLGDEVSQTPGTMMQTDWDWFREIVLARVKQIEGAILRRYRGVPGSQLTLQTDGDDLVREGKEEEAELMKQLQLRTPELPFVKSGSSPAELPLGF